MCHQGMPRRHPEHLGRASSDRSTPKARSLAFFVLCSLAWWLSLLQSPGSASAFSRCASRRRFVCRGRPAAPGRGPIGSGAAAAAASAAREGLGCRGRAPVLAAGRRRRRQREERVHGLRRLREERSLPGREGGGGVGQCAGRRFAPGRRGPTSARTRTPARVRTAHSRRSPQLCSVLGLTLSSPDATDASSEKP